MKKLLILFLPIILPVNLFGFVNQKENVKDNNQNIVWNLNINESKQLDNVGNYFKGVIGKGEYIFNYSINNINNFIAEYPYFIFSSNNYISASVSKVNKSFSLSKKISTLDLTSTSNLNTIQINNLEVSYSSAWLTLNTELTYFNNQLIFSIQYIGFSNYMIVPPSYSILINNITFLNRFN